MLTMSQYKIAVSFYNSTHSSVEIEKRRALLREKLAAYEASGPNFWGYEDAIRTIRKLCGDSFTYDDAIAGCKKFKRRSEREAKIQFYKAMKKAIDFSEYRDLGDWTDTVHIGRIDLHIKADLCLRKDGRDFLFIIFPNATRKLSDKSISLLLFPFKLRWNNKYRDENIICITVPSENGRRKALIRASGEGAQVTYDDFVKFVRDYDHIAGRDGGLL